LLIGPVTFVVGILAAVNGGTAAGARQFH
jgi:hypothetical protein